MYASIWIMMTCGALAAETAVQEEAEPSNHNDLTEEEPYQYRLNSVSARRCCL